MTATKHDLGEAFVALADSLKQGHDVIDTMDYLVEVSTEFTSAIEAGIVLADAAGALHVVASTSERTTDVEEEQLGTDEGPCWEAFRTGHLIEIPTIADTANRWPRFAAAAAERGFQAAHAVPLRLRDQNLGSVNLFSDRPGRLSDADAALAQALADVATIGVIQQHTIEHGTDLSSQLQAALESRIVIEQAKGFIAQRNSLPLDGAFALLRAHARRTNTRIHDVATRVTLNQLQL